MLRLCHTRKSAIDATNFPFEIFYRNNADICSRTISIGKFGSFPTNLLLYRPYHLTFELLDKSDGHSQPRLRIVPIQELNTDTLSNNEPNSTESRDDTGTSTPRAGKEEESGGVEFDIIGEDGTILIRSNRLTIDDPSKQKLTHEEIEALKKAEKSGGKEIIAKILENHSALGEKTSFSLQKYTVKKARKYLRRFTVLPANVTAVLNVQSQGSAYRHLEIREETLGLLMSWANLKASGAKWLVIDDTGGVVVAAMAERMGILHPLEPEEEDSEGDEDGDVGMDNGQANNVEQVQEPGYSGPSRSPQPQDDKPLNIPQGDYQHVAADLAGTRTQHSAIKQSRSKDVAYMSATRNTITLLHPAAQPNISFLKYFGFPPENQSPSHPLYEHLKALSWLSLLEPSSDPALQEPPEVPSDELLQWKSNRKSAYWRKRRRWERMKKAVDDTREGGFDGLVVASGGMDVGSIFRRLVPLVRGGGQVVAYSATAEPLAELVDLYSRERRAAFTQRTNEQMTKGISETTKEAGKGGDNGVDASTNSAAQRLVDGRIPLTYPVGEDGSPDLDDFPVNPSLLLAPTLQTVRARQWQVLPGRTHPVMMGRGGAEGFVFTATRVIPAQGKVEARGRFGKAAKRRKQEESRNATAGAEQKAAEDGITDEETTKPNGQVPDKRMKRKDRDDDEDVQQYVITKKPKA